MPITNARSSAAVVAILLVALLLGAVGARPAMAQDAGFLGTAPAAGSQALLVTSRSITPVELAQAISAAGCPVETLGVIEAGDWLMYVDGAPAYVNAGFLQELATGTPFYVRCKATAAAAFILFTASGGRDIVGVQVDTRAAQHDGYDRIVFEFQGNTVPRYDISYIPSADQCGSGLPVTLDGTAILQVHFPATFVYNPDTAELTIPTRELQFTFPELREAREICAFEAVANWALGVESRQPFRVFEQSAPARLVIDIAQP
jgi:hypothetical protein